MSKLYLASQYTPFPVSFPLDSTAQVRRRNLLGIRLLVVSLSIFFLASMLLYVGYIALRLGRTPETLFVVPRSFWVTTALLLAISTLLHLAIVAVKRDQLASVTIRTGLALVLSFAFLILQSESMVSLIELNKSLGHAGQSPYPYTIVLAVLHALHVVAGQVGLIIVVIKSIMNRYDHENYLGLEMCAIYWHFLDIVWLVMLTSFFVASSFYNSLA